MLRIYAEALDRQALEVETYCRLALSGQRSGRYSGLCVQAVGSGLCGQRLWARDESALEMAWPPDRRLDRRPSAYTTMRYTNRQPLPFTFTFLQTLCSFEHVSCLLHFCLATLTAKPVPFLWPFFAVYLSIFYYFYRGRLTEKFWLQGWPLAGLISTGSGRV